MALPFSARTGSDQANLLPGWGERISDIELKGGALDFGKMVRLVCQPTQRFTKKNLIANPPK
jgi:hypothetical protein